MSTVIATFEVSVEADLQGWTPGCRVWPGQSLRIQCSNSVTFGFDPVKGYLYGWPEGIYSNLSAPAGTGVYDPSHPYDPSACIDYADYGQPASNYMLSELKPDILGVVARLEGTTMSGTDVGGGFRPTRDATYTYDQLAADAKVSDGSPVRVWMVFNNVVGAFGDNAGAFDVTLSLIGDIPMSEPLVSLIRPQFGIESSLGGGHTATRMFSNLENSEFKLDPDQAKASHGIAGIAYQTDEILLIESAKLSAKVKMDYIDLGYFLQSALGPAAHTNIAVGVEQNTWQLSPFDPITPQSYQVETPGYSGDRVQKAVGCVFNGLKIESERDKDLSCSLTGFAQALQDGASASAGQNAVQVVTINGAPDGGTFLLILNGVATAPIAFDAASSAVQSAIRAVTGGSETVSGSAGGPYTVTFPTGIFVAQMSADYSGLTGGTDPTVTIAVTTPGGMKMHTCYLVQPKDVSVSFSATLIGLDSAPTILTDQFKTSIELAERLAMVWRQNTADTSYGAVVMKKASEINDMLSFTMAYNSQVASFITNARSGTPMFCRVKFTSASLLADDATPRSWTFDFAVVPNWKANSDSQGNVRSVDFDLDVRMDPATGFIGQITAINEISDYTAN